MCPFSYERKVQSIVRGIYIYIYQLDSHGRSFIKLGIEMQASYSHALSHSNNRKKVWVLCGVICSIIFIKHAF